MACVLGPLAFAVLLRIQSGTPSDALFGVWVHSSGFAVSLVVLSFAANWGFPILVGVLVGDLFSSEDRHGTWKTILTRSRALREVFLGKVLAAAGLSVLLSLLVAAASLLAGVLLVGDQSLVDFGGRPLGSLHLFALVLASWLLCLPVVLAYASLAILFSVASRNGIVGVLGPLLVSLLTQLLALIGKGVIVHELLVGNAFDAWHGLFADRPFFGPLILGELVCLVWIGAALLGAWWILRRREFAGTPGISGRRGWRAPLQIVAAATGAIALLALASNLGPAGVTRARLTASLAREFRRLTSLQQNLLGHPIPAGAHYDIVPVCNRRGGSVTGPGEWSCTMNVYVLLAPGTQPLTNTPVAYDVSVAANGCFKAQSPPAYVGQALIRDTRGRLVVNPLVVIYGCFNIL